MTDEPAAIDATLALGESLDLTVAVDAAPGATSPLVDGSIFTLALTAVRGSDTAVLRLSSEDARVSPRIEPVSYADPEVTLALRAPAARIAQIPAGEYVGDLIHQRPRVGIAADHGDQRKRIAIINLNIIGGTGS